MACNVLAQSATSAILIVFAVNPAASYTVSFAIGLVHIWPTYSNFCKQALSN